MNSSCYARRQFSKALDNFNYSINVPVNFSTANNVKSVINLLFRLESTSLQVVLIGCRTHTSLISRSDVSVYLTILSWCDSNMFTMRDVGRLFCLTQSVTAKSLVSPWLIVIDIVC